MMVVRRSFPFGDDKISGAKGLSFWLVNCSLLGLRYNSEFFWGFGPTYHGAVKFHEVRFVGCFMDLPTTLR